jgi:uncharacterized integral membrane protein
MVFFLIIGLVIGGAAVLFVLQNITPVEVSFFSWHLGGSLSVIILLALLTGMLISVLIVLPGLIKAEWQVRRLSKENKKLQDDLMLNSKPTPSKVTEPAPVESENVVDLNNL